ncbi:MULTISPECIES: WXG100 family type VII secretion target [Nonomuraea]|uniref:WXG100 family type VII secretion target n=1 Tax=Nonomuraea mangrovi TaxID=2316207 RepID=A0ABW4SRU3_9ACTN
MAIPHNDVGASDRVKVNFGTMDVVSGDLVAMVNRFEQITTDLMRDLALVLGTGDGDDQAGDQNAWGGGAKTFFEQKKVKWNQQAEQMRTELGAAQKHVNTANENYQIAERHNQSMWTQF